MPQRGAGYAAGTGTAGDAARTDAATAPIAGGAVIVRANDGAGAAARSGASDRAWGAGSRRRLAARAAGRTGAAVRSVFIGLPWMEGLADMRTRRFGLDAADVLCIHRHLRADL
jgi:hypothetical protein